MYVYILPISYSSSSSLSNSNHFNFQPISIIPTTLNMALSFQFEKEFTQTSHRVKSVDFHPTEPWILASLHTGTICIWNYESKTMEKSVKVTESPVRSAKFIASKKWIATGADDKFIRVYDYHTTELELVKEFEAHQDFIRSVSVHPTLPLVLSASDDKLIKLWDWEKGWECTLTFEGHSHYVMQAVFDPQDTEKFASASLDHTVKVWNLGSSSPIATLDGHSAGINCVDYLVCADKSYLLSGSDDKTIKVWNYETLSCVQTLEGHTNNVTAVCVHPEPSIIISCSEDETIRVWDAITYQLQNTLTYDLGRVWTIGSKNGSHQVAFGFDEGIITVDVASIKEEQE